MKFLRRFLDDIHRMSVDIATIARLFSANRTQDVLVHLSPAQLESLPFYQRRQAKKVGQ